MSEPVSQLPVHPSLEQLRKQAKEVSASQGVPLAEAQFTLARRYGFDNWAKLARHVESLEPPTLRRFEHLAKDIVSAYTSSDIAAGESVVAHLHRIMSPQTVRARLKDELGITAETPQNGNLTLADAQAFVARAHGFETWAELVTHMSPKRGERPSRSEEPPYTIDRKENIISPRHALTKKDWDEIISLMSEEGITGLNAAGQMTDDVLEKVCRLEHVTHLGLGGSHLLTDDGLRHVARLERLQHLDAGGPRSRLTDRGFEVLRHLRELRRFHSAWTQSFSDAGMSDLRFCDRLESVDLMGTLTGDGTLQALAGKRDLKALKAGRLVTDDGLPHLRHLPAFVSKTWQSGEVKLGLMSYSEGPNHLTLDGPFTNKGLATLTAMGLDGLFGLNLFWHVSELTSEGLEALRRLTNLELVGCKGELCDDIGMRHIAAIPRLRVLMAQGTVAGDDGFIALSRSRSIEYIWGRDCPNLKSRGFAALAGMPALRGLAVSCKNVDDAALSALPRFPALTELLPMDVLDDGFRHVGRCAQLETLWCMYCRETGDAATANIAGLSKLKGYYAGNTKITDTSLEILGRITSLEWVEFWQTAGISDAGVAHLARLPRLREVGVSGSSKVTRKGMDIFPASVKVNYST